MDSEVVELIEDSPFSVSDKFVLCLMHLGLKPAAWCAITSAPWREGDSPLEVEDARLNRAVKAVEAAAKHYDVDIQTTRSGLAQTTLGRPRYHQIISFVCTSSSDALVKFREAEANHDHATIGQLLGYPETAIMAFGTESQFRYDQLPLEFMLAIGQYIGFAPSREHWREEIELVAQWAEAVKLASPIIYMTTKAAGSISLIDLEERVKAVCPNIFES